VGSLKGGGMISNQSLGVEVGAIFMAVASGKLLQFAIEAMAHEKNVNLPLKDGDFPVRYVNVYQRVPISPISWDRTPGTWQHISIHSVLTVPPRISQ